MDKVFPGGRGRSEVPALVGVDLAIAAGDFVTFIGPSGCGKSTLLRLIADLTEPSAGTVRVNGKSARQARLDQDYGIAFQQAGLMDWRTVARNVELPLELRGWDRARRRQRALELLELVGLADFAGARPAELSGGMQQRVAIARALATGAEAAADGRAVRRAGRDDPGAAAGRAGPDRAGDRARPSSSSPTPSRRRSTCPTGWW